MTQMVKNPPAVQETQVQSLGRGDPLEKGKATRLAYTCLESPVDRGCSCCCLLEGRVDGRIILIFLMS